MIDKYNHGEMYLRWSKEGLEWAFGDEEK